MSKALELVVCQLREYKFHLLWNGMAMLEWNHSGMEADGIMENDPAAIGKMLYIMGREAAAAARYYGYEPDEVPGEETLVGYFRAAGLPWEFRTAAEAIALALQYGNDRDYKPQEQNGGMIDIDTLELKKN